VDLGNAVVSLLFVLSTLSDEGGYIRFYFIQRNEIGYANRDRNLSSKEHLRVLENGAHIEPHQPPSTTTRLPPILSKRVDSLFSTCDNKKDIRICLLEYVG